MKKPQEIEINVSNRHTIQAYGLKEKVVRPGTSSSARIYVPLAWEGRRVAVALLDPLDEQSEE